MSSGPARATDLRLAHLHLRGGMYALARSELETLAGADRLDRGGILDLAEVRWRTGDLGGAAAAAGAWLEDASGPEAAEAALDAGTVLAHAISAEAAAHEGAAGDAAFHVQAAAAGLDGPGALDALLAGIAPRAAWPWVGDRGVAPPSSRLAAPVDAARPSMDAAAGDGLPPNDARAPAGAALPGAGAPQPAPPGAPADVAGSGPAGELVDAGRALLAAAPDRAAILLALALRSNRAAADAVLSALDAHLADLPGDAGEALSSGSAVTPALAYVRAEALRAAGRHEEARMAYASAQRLALAPAETAPDRSRK